MLAERKVFLGIGCFFCLFIGERMEIVILEGDLSKFSADAIVNAASTSLEMNGGLAHDIRKHGGKEIEEEALEAAPLELGQAVATSAGKMDAKFVIHAVSMEPKGKSTPESIRSAFKSALELAESLECETVAVPAIGCGIGGASLEEGAAVLLTESKSFVFSSLNTIFFVLHSADALQAFRKKALDLGVALTDWKQYQKQKETEEEQRELEWAKGGEAQEPFKSKAGDAVEKQKEAPSDS